MNRKVSLFVLVLFFAFSSLFALEIPSTDRLSAYISGSVASSVVSEEVFSYPPKNGVIHYSMGLDLSGDIYRNDEVALWGLSFNLHSSYPLLSKKYVNFNESKISDKNLFLSFAFGPVFRFTPSDYLDSSLSLRFGVMSYDYFKEGLILSISIEEKLNYFLLDNLFLSFSLNLTDGFIKFTPNSATTRYDNGYSTAILRIQIGAGYLIGGDRKR